MSVNANLLPDSFSESAYDFIPCDCGMLRDQPRSARGIVKRQQALDHSVGFGLLNRLHRHLELEALLLKIFLEISQASAADRSDRTSRHAQLLGDIFVRPRRNFEKEQPYHPFTF